MSLQFGGNVFMIDPNILPGILDALQTSINALNAFGLSHERISQLCQDFMNNATPVKTCAATSIEDEEMAVLFTKVDFKLDDPEHLYTLDKNDGQEQTKDNQLSHWADIATQKMFRSPYVQQHNSEHKSRFMIDAIILDRLDHLDSGDSERLTWFYDVPLAVWSELKSQWILGRPSNCLMYGNQTKETHKALVVLEAKEHSETDITQLIIYLAAVQDARKKANNKLNGSVFGISTDAYGWQFLFLNSDRKLCVSPTISWLLQRSLVIQWIDQILQDAVRITA